MLPPPVEHFTRSPLASKAQQQPEQDKEKKEAEEEKYGEQAKDAGSFKEAVGYGPSPLKPYATAADVTAAHGGADEAVMASSRGQPPAVHVIIGRGESVQVRVVRRREAGEIGVEGGNAVGAGNRQASEVQVKGSEDIGRSVVIRGKAGAGVGSIAKESGAVRGRGQNEASAQVFVIHDYDDDEVQEVDAEPSAAEEASGKDAHGSADVVEVSWVSRPSLTSKTVTEVTAGDVTVTGVSAREDVREVAKRAVDEPLVSSLLSLRIEEAERELTERGERGEQMKTRREQRRASRAKDLITTPEEASVSPSLRPLSKEEEEIVTRALARTANRWG